MINGSGINKEEFTNNKSWSIEIEWGMEQPCIFQWWKPLDMAQYHHHHHQKLAFQPWPTSTSRATAMAKCDANKTRNEHLEKTEVSGWWFQPLWETSFTLDDYSQYRRITNVPNHQTRFFLSAKATQFNSFHFSSEQPANKGSSTRHSRLLQDFPLEEKSHIHLVKGAP